jgi:hypothetical protein
LDVLAAVAAVPEAEGEHVVQAFDEPVAPVRCQAFSAARALVLRVVDGFCLVL